MRDRPEGLRSVILDGVYPPHINAYEDTPAGFTAAVDTLLAACAADAACRERYPDLEESLDSLLADTAETPFSVTVKHPVDRSPLAIEVGATEIVGGLFDALYDADLIRALPYVIDRLAAGDAEAVIPLAQRSIDFADVLTEGLDLSDRLRRRGPVQRRRAHRRRARRRPDPHPLRTLRRLPRGLRACGRCPRSPRSRTRPSSVPIPTLLTTGGYDPVTPAAFAEVTAAASRHALHPHVPGSGARADLDELGRRLRRDASRGRFLADPATRRTRRASKRWRRRTS